MNKAKLFLVIVVFVLPKFLFGQGDSRQLAKFEPAGDHCLVFAGQSLPAIGGVDDYSDGYMDHFRAPAGFTMYTSLRLNGLELTDDWGDGPCNISIQLADEDFSHMALAVGLSLVNDEKRIANGQMDAEIAKLALWLKSLGSRPVFLRVGYEFDGHPWNHYDREAYVAAFRRIRSNLDQLGVTNVAYVWQSCGYQSTRKELETWYPGDEYVDWVGFSFFNNWKKQKMIQFGRDHGKPVFIAEATPTISHAGMEDEAIPLLLSKPDDAKRAWDEWFTPFFACVNDNRDVVKAICYIGHDWHAREMWKTNKVFRGVDSRLHLSPQVSELWKKEMERSRYIHASEGLFESLAR